MTNHTTPRKPPEQGRERLTSKRREDILAAAVKVFSQKGFNGATTKEIAREAGVAEGTIFRYFKTKKEILLSLLGDYIVESLACTVEAVAGETDEVILTSIISNRLNIIKKNRDLVKLLFTEAQFHPEIREQFTGAVVLKAAGILEKLIADKVAAGTYKQVDSRIATRILVGMTGVFVVWRDYLQGDKYASFDEDEVISHIVDIFLNGIRQAKQAGGKGL